MTISRYHRQIILPAVGEGGQAALAHGHAVVVGVGALGCATADQLARAGVGRLTLIDRDVVERTNLQRQTLFTESDATEGAAKAEAARRRLMAVNAEIRIDAVVADFTASNAEPILAGGWAGAMQGTCAKNPRERGATVLVDGTDNFETRYLLNDLAVKHGVPYVYGGVIATRGMQMSVVPGRGPCLRCVFPETPGPGSVETCDTAGVLGPAVAMAASLQVADAIKLLLGKPELVPPVLREFDVWTMRRRDVDLSQSKDPACPCCGFGRFEHLDASRSQPTLTLCSTRSVQVTPATVRAVDLAALAARLASVAEVKPTPVMVRVRPHGEPGVEMTVFADARALIRGVETPERAKALYDRYVGS